MATLKQFLALAKSKPHGGHYPIRPTVLAQFIPVKGVVIPVIVHGVTDETYTVNTRNARRVEISLPKYHDRIFAHPKDLIYPVPLEGTKKAP